MSTNVMEQLREKAKANPQRVIFPEAHEEKILQAARKALDQGLMTPVLVGNPTAISELAGKIGVSLDGITIADNTDEAAVDDAVTEYVKVKTLLPAKAIKRMMNIPLNYAALLVDIGRADCMVAGLSHTTGEVIMASEMIIGLKEGFSTVSSMGLMQIPGFQGSEGELIGIADCAVVPAPDENELADIAIATADTIKRLMGWEPRVALLSFSTKGSAQHDRIDMILKALEIAKQRQPDLLIDGELQLDSAIVPEVAAKKIKGESPVAGKANIIIFPSLEAGNIGVKLVQRFAKAVAFGPMLQGFAKPVCDLSRGAPVDEIVGAATMVAVCAQQQ